MNTLVKDGLMLCENYLHKEKFNKINYLSNNYLGAATYMAFVAYPSNKKYRDKFKEAMINAYLVDYSKMQGVKRTKKELLQKLGIKDMIWRDIDRAITGGGRKVGGGTRKLIDRFHSYHAFRAYDQAISNNKNISFQTVLGEISKGYESSGSKMSDPYTRIENLKRVFRESRPVLHLTWGLVESFKGKGWTNNIGQLSCGVKPAIYDPSWLVNAIDLSKVVLGLQLLEYESMKMNGNQLRNHKFDPNEIIWLDFN